MDFDAIVAAIKDIYAKIWKLIADILKEAGIELDLSNVPEDILPQ